MIKLKIKKSKNNQPIFKLQSSENSKISKILLLSKIIPKMMVDMVCAKHNK